MCRGVERCVVCSGGGWSGMKWTEEGLFDVEWWLDSCSLKKEKGCAPARNRQVGVWDGIGARHA